VPDRDRARRDVRKRHGIPMDAFVILFCGKYVARKRPLDLVAAGWAAAKKGLSVWSLLLGEGEERGRIEQFCREQRVQNVTLTGFINQASIAEHYACADALAVPSEQDPHPLVVTEGGAFGLPIIASDAIGCIGKNDTARPGFNALVYPCGDPAQLAEAIESLASLPKLYRRMSSASAEISKGQDATKVAGALITAVAELKQQGTRHCPRGRTA
jgi:glycosyltransferase involved in cell wall biosynthesis